METFGRGCVQCIIRNLNDCMVDSVCRGSEVSFWMTNHSYHQVTAPQRCGDQSLRRNSQFSPRGDLKEEKDY